MSFSNGGHIWLTMTDDVWQGFRIYRTMAVMTGGRISTRKSTLYVIGGEGICPSCMCGTSCRWILVIIVSGIRNMDAR